MTHLQPCPPEPPCCPPGWSEEAMACWRQMQELMAIIRATVAPDIERLERQIASLQQQVKVLTFGVTDGSNALPGHVGEFVALQAPDINFPTATSTVSVVAGTLAPGDWNVQAYAYINVGITGAQFYLSPQPPGISDSMGAVIALFGHENVTLVGPLVRANIVAPTVLQFSCTTNNDGPGPTPGIMSVRVAARRMR